ncbi:MAG: DNA mismatch repair endonuclease MutL [Dehalococcoidales bacterium]|nr:MAG: DNA mismatch repair endonuclease MutL [Dehalococcoidales bacterium]
MPIKVLDPQIVSRIAAGEVVDRPASVVKELVENSIDAGSSQISVEARGGGIDLIQVTDNGTGITAAELEYAFQRYATSKINSLEDLDSIQSLGFRGEALPSIAAVSQIEVITCAVGESTGNYLSLREGQVTRREPRGRSQGTMVTVRNLLRNVPARLKFLKSTPTENSHIAGVITHYALAFPEIKFSLYIDSRTALRTPGSGKLVDAVIEVYGLEIARNMLEIGNGDAKWGDKMATAPRVNGMISSPAVSRASRNYLSFFVNRRWVNNRLLAWSVEEAYHGLLTTGKHPVAIIQISVPFNEVDVNIHPTKSEVKFQNERAVFSAVQKAVRQTLIELAPVPRIEDVTTTYQARQEPSQMAWTPVKTRQTTPASVSYTPSFSLPALRLLGQLASSYIVAEGPDGLYLIDQHAAHERIRFEQIQHQVSNQEIEVQGLLEPVTLEVTPKQDAVLESQYQNLARYGFSIEPFGNRTYLVRAVPALLHNRDWRAVLSELWDSTPGDNTDWMEKITISMACHSAVRAGQVLTDDEMRELVRQLEQAAIPNTCPHGRPTLINISSGQLAREFERR